MAAGCRSSPRATGATAWARRRHRDAGEPRDEGAFADALEAYAKDAELRRRHGEAGLAYAQTMDWDRINAAVVRVYLRVIEKRARLARMTGR